MGWMVVPVTKMGKTGIGTGLREEIKSSVLVMLCSKYLVMPKILHI